MCCSSILISTIWWLSNLILSASGEKIIEIQTLACHSFFTQKSVHFSKSPFFFKRLWFEGYFWVIIHKFRASSIFEKDVEKVAVCLIWWLRIIYAWRCLIGHNSRILESLETLISVYEKQNARTWSSWNQIFQKTQKSIEKDINNLIFILFLLRKFSKLGLSNAKIWRIYPYNRW